MIHPISTLGIVHTVVSLLPVVAGIYAFIRYYQIDITKKSGTVYLIGLFFAVLTSFTVSSTGGLNEGHLFGVIVLLFAFGGKYARNARFLGRFAKYLSTFGLSFSFYLSLVPGTNETLTRIPVSHPIADGPKSPAVVFTLLSLLAIFSIGYFIQCWLIRSKVLNFRQCK